jgi:hypothetical protein
VKLSHSWFVLGVLVLSACSGAGKPQSSRDSADPREPGVSEWVILAANEFGEGNARGDDAFEILRRACELLDQSLIEYESIERIPKQAVGALDLMLLSAGECQTLSCECGFEDANEYPDLPISGFVNADGKRLRASSLFALNKYFAQRVGLLIQQADVGAARQLALSQIGIARGLASAEHCDSDLLGILLSWDTLKGGLQNLESVCEASNAPQERQAASRWIATYKEKRSMLIQRFRAESTSKSARQGSK